jgi:hypothetical protein
MSNDCDCGDAQDQLFQYLDAELDEAITSTAVVAATTPSTSIVVSR